MLQHAEPMISRDEAIQAPVDQFPYEWKWRARLPGYYGWPCRMRTRGGMNSAEVEFPDGFIVITSRNALKRRAGVKKGGI